MTKSQETLKEIEKLCVKLIQNYENWDKEDRGWENKVKSEKIEEKYLKIRSNIYEEIKDQMLKDLTLWELDLEGNIQPIPGISVNTKGAGGGYILFGYEPSTNYIHFFFEEPNKDYKKEITRAFVEEIKQNPQDWEIIVEDKRDKPFVEKPMVANRSDCQVVKHKSGRRHNRGYQWYKNEKGEVEGPGFSNEEWAEIENALKNQQQLPFKKDGKDQIKDKSQNPEQQAENQDSPQTDNENYENWNLKQIVDEIQKLKTEIEEIKASQKIGDSEKQIELQKKEERLSKLEKIRSNTTQKPKSDNNFPTGLVIGGGMLALVGLMVALIIKNKKKKKI